MINTKIYTELPLPGISLILKWLLESIDIYWVLTLKINVEIVGMTRWLTCLWYVCILWCYYVTYIWHFYLAHLVSDNHPAQSLYLLSSSITFHSKLQTVTNQASHWSHVVITDCNLQLGILRAQRSLSYTQQRKRWSLISARNSIIPEDFLCQTSVHLLLIMTDR